MQQTGGQSEITLYCPVCQYNLTGLNDFVCPECGTAFDPEQLAIESNKQMIGGSEIALGMIWKMCICFLASMMPVISLITMPIVFVIVMGWNVPVSRRYARRLAHTRRMHHPYNEFDQKRFVTVVGIGLWLVQLVLCLGSIVGGCALGMSFISFH